MNLGDLGSVFSRYFAIGFFLPAFFALEVLAQALSSGFLPSVYESHAEGAQVLIVGALALLVGLLLSGLRYVIEELIVSGSFALPRPGSRWAHVLSPLTNLVLWNQRRKFDRLLRSREESSDSTRQTQAAWELGRRFPSSRAFLLPTAYGNTLRATADYAWTRWGLDFAVAEPRVAALLSDAERELHTDARTDLAFFVNSSVVTVVAIVTLVVDEVVNRPLQASLAWVYPLAGVLLWFFYRQSVQAVERLSHLKRSAIDLHRRELLAGFGLASPRDFFEEREQSRAVNSFVLYGHPLPNSHYQSGSQFAK